MIAREVREHEIWKNTCTLNLQLDIENVFYNSEMSVSKEINMLQNRVVDQLICIFNKCAVKINLLSSPNQSDEYKCSNIYHASTI